MTLEIAQFNPAYRKHDRRKNLTFIGNERRVDKDRRNNLILINSNC